MSRNILRGNSSSAWKGKPVGVARLEDEPYSFELEFLLLEHLTPFFEQNDPAEVSAAALR
jgi:hypothetical protein